MPTLQGALAKVGNENSNFKFHCKRVIRRRGPLYLVVVVFRRRCSCVLGSR